MKSASFKTDLSQVTQSLLNMASENCWNQVSDNVSYLIRKVDRPFEDLTDPFDQLKYKKRIHRGKPLLSLDQAVEEITKHWVSIYLIELYVYKAEKKNTIIEIEVLEKAYLDKNNIDQTEDKAPSLHCKLQLPPYLHPFNNKKQEKYNINWQWGDPVTRWKIFRDRVRHILLD